MDAVGLSGGWVDTLPSALRRTARGAGCLSCQWITTRSAFVVSGAIALSEHDALQSEMQTVTQTDAGVMTDQESVGFARRRDERGL